MNIFLHELKSSAKSIIIWSLSMAALAVMYIFIFTGLGSDIAEFQDLMNSLPEMAKKLLSVYAESLSTLEGFYSFVFVYVVLCGAIQAMNLGLSIISKELREKTADFLLTKPVSRRTILTWKLAAAFAAIVITNIIYMCVTFTAALSVKGQFSMKAIFMISLTLLLIQAIFMVLGVVVAAMAGKLRSVIAVSLGTVFGFFILNMFGSVIGEKAIRYITPFKFFDYGYIIRNSAYEAPYLAVGAGFVVLAVAVSYLVYVKKDIHAV
ncbi:ABC-2 family transporter protein [Ruminiclostridium hungatei]|uniref:ABC-2 family transporter protein n=1 Tax=Ruminiclostridium hungatei TaxID=48256 RepID=A0A1V4SJ83_RUMHU|nr:ABC transporter permease subunit [Ruminiclostridium hungatei]OPX43948.1 ABC-2 family transporter protein [Ruminiclostridium hungatei]